MKLNFMFWLHKPCWWICDIIAVTYSLCVDGMDSKQQSRYEAGASVQEQAAEVEEEDTHHGVENYIEEVVWWGAQLAEQVIEAEGENSKRPVGLMAPLLEKKNKVGYKNITSWETVLNFFKVTSDIGVPQKSLRKRFFSGVVGRRSLLSKIAETSSNTKPQNRLFQ